MKVSVNSNDLWKGLVLTSFCTSKEATKLNLQGVCFEISNEKLTLVSTDGKRLSRFEMTASSTRVAQILVDSDFKGLIKELKALHFAPVIIEISEDRVEFSYPSKLGTLTIKRLNCTFPDYKCVMPGNSLSAMAIGEDFGIDITYLAELSKALTTVDKKATRIQIKAAEEDGPRVILTNIINFTHLIMPMK